MVLVVDVAMGGGGGGGGGAVVEVEVVVGKAGVCIMFSVINYDNIFLCIPHLKIVNQIIKLYRHDPPFPKCPIVNLSPLPWL